jgi:hypothetical protein
MTSIEFFFDPVCPFAWLTSRWAVEVADQRSDVDIEWRFISLLYLNEGKDVPEMFRRGHRFGLGLLRIAAAVRAEHGNDGVAAVYTAFGDKLHTEGGSAALFAGEDPQPLLVDALAAARLPASYAELAEDASRDGLIRSETELALSRTGPDVGTPIITYDLDRPESSSYFGPVINRIPRGAEALELWDAIVTLTRVEGMSELKRSLRGDLDFS